MTVSEMVAELIERADEVDNRPLDETTKLVNLLADTADRLGLTPLAARETSGLLTDAERASMTPAIVERAEREMQRRSDRTAAKAQKVNDARALPILPKKADGWWLDNRAAGDETMPELGPYDTKKEAEEARTSLLRSRKELAKDAAKNAAKAKALAAGTGAKKKAGKSSEPTVATSVTTSIQTEGVTPETESEDKVTTATKPKKTSKAKHKANGKPAKVKNAKTPRAEKAAVKKDGPAKVRYEKSACYVAGKILKKHGLKKGITQQMVDEAAEEIGRKNPHQDWFNLRNAWQAIRAYIGQPVDGPKDE